VLLCSSRSRRRRNCRGIAEELNIFNLILLLKEEGGRRNCRGIEIEIFKFN
jgi:hypothetical protein